MNFLEINHCPGTLAEGFSTYSRTCLNKVFQGKKVNHILPYNSPSSGTETDTLFEENRNRISISGVQEKFSVVLEKNKLRLVNEKEIGQYILKPIPSFGKKVNQMPANEHLTMQIAKQVYAIETAENALIFFNNGEPAYLTKRFDFNKEGNKLAQEDFASLAQRTPQTHGVMYQN
jgi:serine/threonine-protein kinase HipA